MAKKESKKCVITSLKRKNNIKKRGEQKKKKGKPWWKRKVKTIREGRKKVMHDNLGHEKKKNI